MNDSARLTHASVNVQVARPCLAMGKPVARLQAKPCGMPGCTPEMRTLWAKAHLAVMRWDELQAHPNDPGLRAVVTDHMERLRAAAKLAEPVMEVRPEPPTRLDQRRQKC